MLFEHTLSRINADKDNAWALDCLWSRWHFRTSISYPWRLFNMFHDRIKTFVQDKYCSLAFGLPQ
jgi:hypothetical protein